MTGMNRNVYPGYPPGKAELLSRRMTGMNRNLGIPDAYVMQIVSRHVQE